ncbi:MAG: DUF559 domain-containing protein [Mesorhizobium sp.]
MPTAIDSAAISRARALRRDMTDGERRLWAELREFRRWYGIHVRRQAPIGAYVADFVIHARRLVIEVDGQHHFEPERLLRDRKRDGWLAEQGYRVLRFNTGELSDAFEGCIEEILRELGVTAVKENTPVASPSPQGSA